MHWAEVHCRLINFCARHARLTLSSQNASLHCCTIRHCLIGVDALVRLLAIKEVLQQLLDLGDTRGTTHQHTLMLIGLLEVGVVQSLRHTDCASTTFVKDQVKDQVTCATAAQQYSCTLVPVL